MQSNRLRDRINKTHRKHIRITQEQGENKKIFCVIDSLVHLKETSKKKTDIPSRVRKWHPQVICRIRNREVGICRFGRPESRLTTCIPKDSPVFPSVSSRCCASAAVLSFFGGSTGHQTERRTTTTRSTITTTTTPTHHLSLHQQRQGSEQRKKKKQDTVICSSVLHQTFPKEKSVKSDEGFD